MQADTNITDQELYKKYNEMSHKLRDMETNVSNFHKENRDAILRYEKYLLKERRIKSETKKEREMERRVKIYEYLQKGMWVKVKTRSGSVWQVVSEKLDRGWKQHPYLCVKCLQPRRNSEIIQAYRSVKKVFYKINREIEPQDIERSEEYVMESIISVLVETQSDKGPVWVEKSFRKNIFPIQGDVL